MYRYTSVFLLLFCSNVFSYDKQSAFDVLNSNTEMASYCHIESRQLQGTGQQSDLCNTFVENFGETKAAVNYLQRAGLRGMEKVSVKRSVKKIMQVKKYLIRKGYMF